MDKFTETQYPCSECKVAKSCIHSACHVRCKKWLQWYHETWSEIRKTFSRRDKP
nr:MAG TPA: hypothetical protein [Caudoviricetes sp.]